MSKPITDADERVSLATAASYETAALLDMLRRYSCQDVSEELIVFRSTMRRIEALNDIMMDYIGGGPNQSTIAELQSAYDPTGARYRTEHQVTSQ